MSGKAENDVNVFNPEMNKLHFLIEELAAFFTQVLIFFCVAMLLSNGLSNEADLIKFAESKLASHKEFLFTLIATIFALGLLTTMQKLSKALRK
ncbi:Uncharacterised protein [Neisseria animaloris]|uniref:hypothetical protein n=1 Tax=Neisseria animaloris TaxID=326522 RepID=UPI000A1974AA|nr:hypothetical protein [Neisseria animaloris]OSI08911.1 hypothetical protein BWD08_02075 [Neisseria animaloris]VEH87104.1 Uncharacterised protein [Neisseria animaloris]